MKNILNYYYNIYPYEISYKDDNYFFEYNNNMYVFEKLKRPIADINSLYKINRQMLEKNILVHEIILNKENNILTQIHNNNYVLMEIHINMNLKVSLAELCYINNNTINIKCDNILNRYDWTLLWEQKNDYFENQINEIGNKYPNLAIYINYYIGLAENAIMYVKNALKVNNIVLYSMCHKRLDCNCDLFYLYHPLNFIYDYRIRDFSEYIKSSFFQEKDVYSIIKEYFKYNYISYKEALLLYGRLLYPSYFFDIYDEIINNNIPEENINKIINKTKEYESFLIDINNFLSNMYNTNFPKLDWLIK